MPESQQPEQGQEAILREVKKRPEHIVLDVGAGSGRWGKLLRGHIKCVDAVEAWEPNIKKYGLSVLYNSVYQEDIRHFDFESRPYTAAVLGDVLEHMPKHDALRLLERLKNKVEEIFLIIPITVCVQDGTVLGNPYETHHYHWSDRELREEGFQLLRFDMNPNHLVVIGAYVWKKCQP
jgi:predicted TPR repeat methyltransferase